jgi:hypothetical protein
MIEEKTIADRIEVLENGVIQVRTRSDVFRDNVVIASSFTRKVIVPGDDFSQEDEKVKGICSSVHTSEVVEAYKEFIKKLSEENLVPEEGNPVE